MQKLYSIVTKSFVDKFEDWTIIYIVLVLYVSTEPVGINDQDLKSIKRKYCIDCLT